MLKQQLRKQYLEKRSALSARQRSDFSAKVCTKFIDLIDPEIQTIHLFLPIVEKFEINTWDIVHQLWKKQIEVVVPVLDFKNNRLLNKRLKPDSEIVENRWGVPEPVSEQVVANELIDLVVTPLLTFDQFGNRVGYGKGYYDRFLATFLKLPKVVGLSHFPPVSRIDDFTAQDIKMDICVTPEEVFKF